MEYRQLGSSGMRVSCLGLGCFAFAGDKSTGSHLGKASDSALHPALRSFSDA
jgi:aryl-alcohol dehydrogenase-like predicted oxidoreductase